MESKEGNGKTFFKKCLQLFRRSVFLKKHSFTTEAQRAMIKKRMGKAETTASILAPSSPAKEIITQARTPITIPQISLRRRGGSSS